MHELFPAFICAKNTESLFSVKILILVPVFFFRGINFTLLSIVFSGTDITSSSSCSGGVSDKSTISTLSLSSCGISEKSTIFTLTLSSGSSAF